MRKTWTDEDIAYMEENYNKFSLDEIADHLGRTKKSVALYASRHGLSGSRVHMKKEHGDYIRAHYGEMTSTQIAQELGITREEVRNYVHYHKIKSKGYFWTDEDIEMLDNSLGSIGTHKLAKRLGRSVNSVRCKAQLEGIGSYKNNTDDMTATTVAEILGMHRSTLYKDIYKGRLKSTKRGNYRMIREKDLLRFMQEYPDRWTARKCDRYLFQRHNWFMDKLKKEIEEETKKRWGEWLTKDT